MKIEERDMSEINAVKQKQQKEKLARKIKSCYSCGQIHYYKEYPFRRKEYFNSDQKVPFETEVSISVELDRLEQIDLLNRMDYSE